MQFDVHRNSGASSGYAPFLLNLQADLLDHLDTRIVAPLISVGQFGRRADRLHPVFTIDLVDVVLAAHLLAAVRAKSLGPVLGTLNSHRHAIIAAVDVLWAGV